MGFVVLAIIVAIVLFVLLGFRKVDGIVRFKLGGRQILALLAQEPLLLVQHKLALVLWMVVAFFFL